MRCELSYPITLSFIADAIGEKKEKHFNDIVIKAISTDTRELFPGDLFIAIKGQNYDGDDFLPNASEIGAYTLGGTGATLFSENTKDALLKIANAYKRCLNIKYTVAITGSIGKTTTKNLTYALLSTKFKAHATDKNYNNEIGVPFTVLSAPADCEVLIIEAGMNHSGELSALSNCIEPDISVITKIGTAHIGNLGGRKAIADEKLHILDGMKKKYAILPYGEPLLEGIDSRSYASVTDNRADRFLLVKQYLKDYFVFDYTYGNTVIRNIRFYSQGAHIPECLLFAISVCIDLGMSDNEISRALSMPYRIDSLSKTGNLTVLDDSYNSSPEAVMSSIKTIKSFNIHPCGVVLGDMLELGDYSFELHKSIGAAAALADIDFIFTIGVNCNAVIEGALSCGFDPSNVFKNENASDLRKTADQISNTQREGIILLKASHGIELSRIIDLLKEKM